MPHRGAAASSAAPGLAEARKGEGHVSESKRGGAGRQAGDAVRAGGRPGRVQGKDNPGHFRPAGERASALETHGSQAAWPS